MKSPETAETGSNEALSSDGNARFRVPPLVTNTLLVVLVDETDEVLVLELVLEVRGIDDVVCVCDVIVEDDEEFVANVDELRASAA